MNLEPIDTSTTEGKADVMRLAAEGRRVVQRTSMIYRWMEIQPCWNWSAVEYAIIAETVGPHVVWATVIDGGVVMDVYATEQEADAALNRGWEKVKYIRADLAGEGA